MCTLSRSLLLAIALGSMLFAVGPSYAATETFVKPKQGANRLDWCLNWGQGCGAEAANAKGYAGGSSSFSIAADIGAATPTRLIATGAVCDQGYCDGFAKITCEP
jgi:hypothetical protein